MQEHMPAQIIQMMVFAQIMDIWRPGRSMEDHLKIEYLHSPKMFLLSFSFTNFETTRGSKGKAKISHCPKKVTPQFSKFANEKARRNIIWRVYTYSILSALAPVENNDMFLPGL